MHKHTHIHTHTHTHACSTTGQSEHDDVERRNRNQRYAIEDANKRLSLLDMEARPFTHAPMIASPAAVGYGPTFANPTILGMMPEMPKFEESTDGGEEGNDSSLLSTSGMGLSPEVCSMHSSRQFFN